ncbi:hypothetical protein JW930_02590 [Candidatus Woesearchaeota archaeon]|nr:hypothetical protein [Candidatus Woesearchaeota archaeon]
MTDILDMSKYGFHRIIHYTGIFDFDGLYKLITQWMKHRDWDIFEPEVKHKEPYRVYKLYGRKKVTFYAMLTMKIELWLQNAREVEVIQQGQKKSLTEAKMKIIVNGGYITDYDGDFEKGPGLKKFEAFLNNYVMYHDILLKYFDYMDYYLYDFMQDVKKFLGMETATHAY